MKKRLIAGCLAAALFVAMILPVDFIGRSHADIPAYPQSTQLTVGGVLCALGFSCSPPTPIYISSPTISNGVTDYLAVGNISVSQGVGMPVAGNGVFSNLSYAITTAPTSANTVTITLVVGTKGALSATALTCQITSTATTCADASHNIAVTAGQYWALQVVTVGPNSTGVNAASMLFGATS